MKSLSSLNSLCKAIKSLKNLHNQYSTVSFIFDPKDIKFLQTILEIDTFVQKLEKDISRLELELQKFGKDTINQTIVDI